MPEYRRSRALAAGTVLLLVVAMTSVDYTVQRGDTLAQIAQEYGVTVAELAEANEIANPNLIYPGQVLVIPGEDGEPDTVYVVIRGDTLAKIAASFDTTVTVLVEANDIANPNLILVGQQILIPNTGSVAEPENPDNGGGMTEGDETKDDAQADQGETPRSGRYHVVARGDTLESIAAQYKGVTADQIAAANGIINGVVYVGTRLFLDGPSFVAKGSEGTTAYTVKKGDRLADIAALHDTTVTRLVEMNNIANPNLIRIGQQLQVPNRETWLCPVPGATFFNDWGFPRGGGTRWHEGNDLFAPEGTPVYAPVSGVVEFKTGSIGGKQFNLHGADGVLYIGSHMSYFGKSGRVNAGDLLGATGTTGNAVGTRAHIHFAMYLDDGEGPVVNPYPSLIANGCKG
ncbi:MAG: LysM peptidoglycan-binding domain-containing protein [Acidimicrobiia bacterium]